MNYQRDVFQAINIPYSLGHIFRINFVCILICSTMLPIVACSTDDDDSEGGIIGTGVKLSSIANGDSKSNNLGDLGDGCVNEGDGTGIVAITIDLVTIP